MGATVTLQAVPMLAKPLTGNLADRAVQGLWFADCLRSHASIIQRAFAVLQEDCCIYAPN